MGDGPELYTSSEHLSTPYIALHVALTDRSLWSTGLALASQVVKPS